MTILATVVIGFLVGLIARFLLPGRDPLGLVMTTLLGIGGALLASFTAQTLGFSEPGRPAGFLASVLGAIVVLTLVRALRRH